MYRHHETIEAQDLANRGAELIRGWFADRFPNEATESGSTQSSRAENSIAAHSSPKAFKQYDVYATIIAEYWRTGDLSGMRGAVLGCDWGVSALYLLKFHGLQKLHAVDVASNYGGIAETLAQQGDADEDAFSISLAPIESLTHTDEKFDFVILTRSLTFPVTTSGRMLLAAVLDCIKPGGVLLVYPQDKAGIHNKTRFAERLIEHGFSDIKTFNHEGVAETAERIPAALGQESSSSGMYLAARRQNAESLLPRGYNSSRNAWTASATAAVERWYEESDYVNVANIRGGNARTMVNDTIASFCTDKALSNFDRIVSLILAKSSWTDLSGRSGMIFGCDWGFNTLHIASEWQPERLVGVDITGKYGKASRQIIGEQEGLFNNTEIIDAGPGRMGKYAGQFDFLIMTKSFTLLDNGFDRLELLRVLQVLKPGGYLVYYPDQTPGLLKIGDYSTLLQAGGLAERAILDWNGNEVADISKGAAQFVFGRKVEVVKPSEIKVKLKEIKQDAESLMAKRAKLDYPAENIVERSRRIQESIKAGNAVLDTLPLRYTMNMLSVCNIKCIFCDYPDRLRHWSLPETFLGDVLDTFDGTLRVQITGGETMMSPSSIGMLERAKGNPFLQLEVITNMTIEKPGLMEQVARGASFVTCSIDAATQPTYDKIRQDSNFERVVRNLKELVRIRNELGLHYPHVQINFIIMGHNPHEVGAFMDLAKEIGADSVAYKWLLWTLTPRITEQARFDFNNERVARILCENIHTAHEKSIEHNIRIVWGPVPFHIKDGRPDLYDEYGLDEIFGKNSVDWIDPKHIFAEKPRLGTESTFSPDVLDDAIDAVDDMPDGLMPCTAPFTTMQINGPRNANFCCYSTAEYRAVPIDASGSLIDAWNHPKLVEARQYFLDGNYAKVCRPHCSLFREYLERKRGQRVRSKAELEAAKSAAMSADAEWDPNAQ